MACTYASLASRIRPGHISFPGGQIFLLAMTYDPRALLSGRTEFPRKMYPPHTLVWQTDFPPTPEAWAHEDANALDLSFVCPTILPGAVGGQGRGFDQTSE